MRLRLPKPSLKYRISFSRMTRRGLLVAWLLLRWSDGHSCFVGACGIPAVLPLLFLPLSGATATGNTFSSFSQNDNDQSKIADNANLRDLSDAAFMEMPSRLQAARIDQSARSELPNLASPWALCRKRDVERCESETEADSPGLVCDKIDLTDTGGSSPSVGRDEGAATKLCTHHITQPVFCFAHEDGSCTPANYCEKATDGAPTEPWQKLYGEALFKHFEGGEQVQGGAGGGASDMGKCRMVACEAIRFPAQSGDAKAILAHKVRVCANAFSATGTGSLAEIKFPHVCEYSKSSNACALRDRKQDPYPEYAGEANPAADPDEAIERVFKQVGLLKQWMEGSVDKAFDELDAAKVEVSTKLKELEEAAENRRIAKQRLVDYLAYRRFQIQIRAPALGEMLGKLNQRGKERLQAVAIAGEEPKGVAADNSATTSS